MSAETNPFLIDTKLFDGALPFNQIKNSHFVPALKSAIEIAKKNVTNIIQNTAAPTFENTILAIETCSDNLDIILFW